MQLKSPSLSTDSREAFCLALKTARERKGITLDEIAAATKIPASLFAALERNDLRHWPEGLFKRSFFRDYVSMIGVPVSEACGEFVRLFIADSDAEATTAEVSAPPRWAVIDSFWRGRAAIDAAWTRGSALIARLLPPANDADAGPAEEPGRRPWVTDARRVGPARSRGFRVRVKLPR